MYLRILKKDIQRKKTMNAILLIFIILAATFISSSANNMITVASALDDYFEMAKIPDYWLATTYEDEAGRLADFAKENGYRLETFKFTQIDSKDVTVNNEAFDYNNSVELSVVSGTKAFDENENEITQVNDGELYVTSEIFNSEKNNLYNGCKIVIDTGNGKKEFTLKGYSKDALFGSPMLGMTRFLISENDYRLFDVPEKTIFYSLMVYTDDHAFMDKLNQLDPKTIINVDRAAIKMMYIMDTLIAAVVLVVSICLILISMVILRFTIHFTMNEEFREIGVMKAIGISNPKIRGLYVTKYFAVAAVGSAIGLALSFPFGGLLIESVARNIIIAGKNKYGLNVAFAAMTAASVVLFCYSCTGRIRNFSPIDAIRNGGNKERYFNKSILRLSRFRLPLVLFMALNDILSGWKKYVSMILIFTLGILLIIIPVNTINTLQSDRLITWFNMADCDLVLSQNQFFLPNGRNADVISETLEDVTKTLQDNGIEADVFQEIMFRFTVSKGDKSSSSLAFLGVGAVTADMYSYIEGTPPQNEREVALSFITADRIGAAIGDEVDIRIGDETRRYTVTAINQSMNNLGEGIRFYQGDDIDLNLAGGSFGVQILYRDSPDRAALEARKKLLLSAYPDRDVFTAGEYISYMIGDVAGQLKNVKRLILGMIFCINILVAVLMVKSFIAREKGEIAMLKAIGFHNVWLAVWQSARIGIVLLISIMIGTAVSKPLSHMTVEPIFRMMGAYSITFEIIPLEVYVIYPLAVFFTTVLAASAGALRLRKIAASETSNIE